MSGHTLQLGSGGSVSRNARVFVTPQVVSHRILTRRLSCYSKVLRGPFSSDEENARRRRSVANAPIADDYNRQAPITANAAPPRTVRVETLSTIRSMSVQQVEKFIR